MDSGDFKAEHHPLIVDGLVCLQKLVHGFVDSLWDSALDDMTYPYFGTVDGFSPEERCAASWTVSQRQGVKWLLVVFGENRDHTITLQVAE